MEMKPDPAPADATSTEPLPSRDEAAALEAAGGDADLARELLETLLQGLPAELATLQDCLLTDDRSELEQTTHRIRGATSYCGVPALDRRLRELERSSQTADRDRIAGLLREVSREADRLRNSISV